jgi:hypothetical protein
MQMHFKIPNSCVYCREYTLGSFFFVPGHIYDQNMFRISQKLFVGRIANMLLHLCVEYLSDWPSTFEDIASES